jgi:hypothetical protein
MHVKGEEREVGASSVGLTFLSYKKYYNLQTKKIKLNSDCTIKFVLINTSKQDVT